MKTIAAGILWALLYNLIWGIAWFAFMKRDWTEAMAEVGRPIPWTQEVWLIWLALTVPLGIATMAHVAYRRRSASLTVAVLQASGVIALLLGAGMIGWGLSESLPMHVFLADTAVNVVGVVVAAYLTASLVESRNARFSS